MLRNEGHDPGYLDEYKAFRRQPEVRRRTWEEMQAEKATLKPVILDLYRHGGTLVKIREVLGLHRVAIDRWRKEDPEFDTEMHGAIIDFHESLEDEAYRRAVTGVGKPVYQAGKRVMDVDADGEETPAIVKEYSDTLLIFLIKGNMPKKYRDRLDVTHRAELPRAESSPEQIEAVRRAITGRIVDGGGEPASP